MVVIEVIQVTKINQSKAFIPKRVRQLLGIDSGDYILWAVNEKGDIIVKKNRASLDEYNFL